LTSLLVLLAVGDRPAQPYDACGGGMEIDLLNTYEVCGQERLERLYELETVSGGQRAEVETVSAHRSDSQLHSCA
jgi:hypothetical protein